MTAWSHLQSAQTDLGPVSGTVSLSVSALQAGALLVIGMNTAPAGINGISDAAGNPYFPVAGPFNFDGAGDSYLTMYVGLVATGGPTSLSLEVGSAQYLAVALDEFADGGLPLQILNTSGNAATGTAMGVPSFVTVAQSLVVATYVNDDGALNVTAGSGYTRGAQDTQEYVANIYRLSSVGTETCPATLASSALWAGVAFNFGAQIPYVNPYWNLLPR